MKLYYSLPLLLLSILAFTSCIPDQVEIEEQYYYPEELALIEQHLNLPEEPLDYNVELPQHMLRSGLFARAINRDMATLGRVLFYDDKLSKNEEVSCASCHKQSLAFADGKALSDGVDGQKASRNSLALGSVVSFAAYYGINTFGSFGIPFLWDNAAGTATQQAEMAWTSEVEMGMTMAQVVDKVAEQEFYGPLFRRAFGSEEVTEERVLAAMAEFIDGLASFESKFDEAAAASTNGLDMSVEFSGFTPQENRGKTLYLNHCGSCHNQVSGRPSLTAANNGLDVVYDDEGVGGVSGNQNEMYLFKVPTLRNIALTGPYMHDGRFETLEEVIDFYSENVANHPQLDPLLRDANGQPKRLNLSAEDKDALIVFLETLTDEEYLVTEKYSDPFK